MRLREKMRKSLGDFEQILKYKTQNTRYYVSKIQNTKITQTLESNLIQENVMLT